jgi:Leucine-rich repeat (LRR) protein
VDLISLPEEMGELTSLETLNLTSSTIESFPHSIGKLKNLKNLQLRHTKYLSTLPEVIGDLSSLEKLDLDDSNIASLPSSIGRLKNLENLDLRNTRHLSGLPEEIGELTRLETLTLCFSAIVSLPPSIGKLKNLKRLYLSYTKKLSTLPEEIGKLTNLQKLDLLNSGITALPDSLVCLKAPLVLYIKLTKIPELQQEDHEEFLTQLVQQCQSLVGVFSIVSHDHGFDAYGNELHYALAYNRYKYNIEFGIVSQDVTPKLWPFALQNAKYAFRGNKFYISWYPEDAWYYKSPINQHDAIYRLLVDGRESFNQMLLTRRKRH